MTQRYAHLAPENLREAIRVLDQDDHNFITVCWGEHKKIPDSRWPRAPRRCTRLRVRYRASLELDYLI